MGCVNLIYYFPTNMELLIVGLVGLFMIHATAGQGTDGWNALAEIIKKEVSNQVKLEGNAIKEEIMRMMRKDREKQDENRRTLDNTREGNFIIFNYTVWLEIYVS